MEFQITQQCKLPNLKNATAIQLFETVMQHNPKEIEKIRK